MAPPFFVSATHHIKVPVMWSCAARHIKAAYKVSTTSLYSKSLLKVSLMLVRRALVIYLHKHSSFRLRRPIFELQNLGL